MADMTPRKLRPIQLQELIAHPSPRENLRHHRLHVRLYTSPAYFTDTDNVQ